MLTKEERSRLVEAIKAYAQAEINVGVVKSDGDLADPEGVREAVAEASAKLEALYGYVKEIS